MTTELSTGALVPDGWQTIDGLVCGFGDRAARAPRETVLLRRQLHGTRVVHWDGDRFAPMGDGTPLAPDRDAADGLRRIDDDADAIVAARGGSVVGIRTADCVPILLVSRPKRWAAAVHAGWRGTLAAIVTEALGAARAAGVAPGDLDAALGPSIGACCYEVSPDIGADFARAGFPVVRTATRPRLDLRAANRVLLEKGGIEPARISSVGPCTRCAHDRYHSFRAEPASEGRQVSWIGWADRTPSLDRAPTR